MEGSAEPHYVEGEGLSPIVGLIPKGNGQIDLSEWCGLLSRDDTVERRSDWAEVRLVDAHYVERLRVHDVEAATSILQNFGEALWVDDRVDHKRIPSRVQDDIWMVNPIEGYGGL